MRLNRLMKLIFWVVLFEVIGYLLGLITQSNIYPWYEGLNKSSLTPPGIVFSIVWSVLYALLALIAWRLFEEKSSKLIITLFSLQMVLNWLWTPLFFQFHWLIFSAIWLVILTCINVILFLKTKNNQIVIAGLLIPYILWLIFASYLNVFIALMN